MDVFEVQVNKPRGITFYKYSYHINFNSVVVNFLSLVIFIFLLFQLHNHTLPYPKTKEEQKLPEIKHSTTNIKQQSFFGADSQQEQTNICCTLP